MSTKVYKIKRDSWHYKLYTIQSYGRPPKRMWQYWCGVLLMMIVYVAIALQALVMCLSAIICLSIVVSPIYDHIWPGSWYFGTLHERTWPKLQSALPLCLVIFVLIIAGYSLRKPLKRLAAWMYSHRPTPRAIKTID